MEPVIADRGSHIEVLLGVSHLRRAEILELLAGASNRFGRKSCLVICDDPQRGMSLADAYQVGVDIARRFPEQAVAIVLRGRPATEAEYFTELVAANRGARVRYFHDSATALSWLIR